MKPTKLNRLGMERKEAYSDVLFLDKCYICKEPASKVCGNCEAEYYCGKDHQRLDWTRHRSNCCKYEIRKHETFGNCMFANKCIQAGELIASEYPLAIYNELLSNTSKNLQNILTISEAIPYSCPSCGIGKLFPEKLHRCSKCCIPLCQAICETTGLHSQLECKELQKMGIKASKTDSLKNILTDITILRVLLKEHNKGNPISFENRKWKVLLRKVFVEKLSGEDENNCSNFNITHDILSSLNAADNLPMCLKFCNNKEMIILLHCALSNYGLSLPNKKTRKKFLYIKNHWLTHSCMSNAELWIEKQEKNYKLIIKATRLINPGQRITINKAEEFSSVPTYERRKFLKDTHGIDCCCARCIDPSEMGTFLSAIRCEENLVANPCGGHYTPVNSLGESTKWKCSKSSCKSRKTHAEIKLIVRNVEIETPSVNGKADEVLKKLKNFIEYYEGDLLSSSHYIMRIIHSRTRELVKHFFGTQEKMLICVFNDYPRAYEHCCQHLNSNEAILEFVDKICPQFNEPRGILLYEKGSLLLASALYLFHILQKIRIPELIKKLQDIIPILKDAAKSISIYDHASTLKDSINFMGSVINKLLKNQGNSSCTIDVKVINSMFSNVQHQSKEIGLVSFYLEPTNAKHPSVEILRNIIISEF